MSQEQEYIEIESYPALVEYFFKEYKLKEIRNLKEIYLMNLKFLFPISIPFRINKIGITNDQRDLSSKFVNNKYLFENCKFEKKVTFNRHDEDIFFTSNCNFEGELKVNTTKGNLTFKQSYIRKLNLENSKFGISSDNYGKLRLKKCIIEETNFKNATFNGLVDFYQTTFKEKVIFNKTDFFNVLVLSATKFEKNMLFTYTLLNDKVIMRGTKFFKGFDISLAIIKGELALFDIQLDDKKYIAEESELSEDDYEDFVANKGRIPISNKRETYRVLKKEFISNADYIHSLKYKRFELETYDKILVNNINQNFDKWKSRFNRFILYLNRKSNNYGTRFEYGVGFIFVVSLLFGLSTLLFTQSFWNHVCLGCNFDEVAFTKGLKFYINFLNPVHRIDYLDSLQPFFGIAYLFDFLGRIFIGYGVYQTIQAFRKYK